MTDPKLPARLVILFLILVLAACAVLIVFRSPLAPMLRRAETPVSGRPTETAVLRTPTSAATQASPSPTIPRPTATQGATCGLTQPVTILFTGTGAAQGIHTADAIRVIKIDPGTREVIILAFPRDLFVKTNVLESAGMPEGRLGALYSYKKQITAGTEREKTVAATTVLAQVLYDNFGVTPDHYITMRLETWGQMIDAVGGVEVTNPEPLSLENGAILPAGSQRLDGENAVEFVRVMTDGGEQERLARQDLLLRALHRQARSGESQISAGDLLTLFSGEIVTDLTPQQLTALACLAQTVPESGVTFASVDESMVSADASGALIPDVDAIRALVEQIRNR